MAKGEMTEKEFAQEYLVHCKEKFAKTHEEYLSAKENANKAEIDFHCLMQEMQCYADNHGGGAADYHYLDRIASAAKKWAEASNALSTLRDRKSYLIKEIDYCYTVLNSAE